MKTSSRIASALLVLAAVLVVGWSIAIAVSWNHIVSSHARLGYLIGDIGLVVPLCFPRGWPAATRDDSLRAFRYSRQVRSLISEGCPIGTARSWVDTFSAFRGRFRSGDFQARQQFKINADCAAVGPASLQETFAFDAFRLIEGGKVTLLGAADIPRLERVLDAILRSVDMSAGEVHFDRVQPEHSAIALSLPTETRPMWVTVPSDDLVAARVVVALNRRVSVSRLRVSGGFVELESPATVPDSILAQLRQLEGVRDVRVFSPPQE